MSTYNQPTSKMALLIIDMINDFQFTYGPTLAEKASKMSPTILCLKQKMKEHHLPVIYVNDYYNLRQADLNKLVKHCRNDLSQPVIDLLYPNEDDYFILKPKHSAFFGTSLEVLLQQLKVNTLILTGVAGNICVLFTANDAYMRDYFLITPSDCIASNSDQDNLYALTMMENVLKATRKPSHIILNQLNCR